MRRSRRNREKGRGNIRREVEKKRERKEGKKSRNEKARE